MRKFSFAVQPFTQDFVSLMVKVADIATVVSAVPASLVTPVTYLLLAPRDVA